MRILFPMIILTVANVACAEWPKSKMSIHTIRYIKRQKDLPAYDVSVGNAIDKSLPSKPVVLFPNLESLQIKTNPGMNTEFEFELAHLAGGGFAPVSVFVDGKLIGKTEDVTGKVKAVVSKFKTPMLYSHGVELELKLQEKGDIGIIHFDWNNIAFKKVPENVWQTTFREGEKKTAVKKTYFSRASSWAAMAFKFHGVRDAVIKINGEEREQIKANTPTEFMIKGHKMKSGLNLLTVEMPGAEEAKFSLEVNPDSYYFLKEIPEIINPELNVDNWPKATISNGKVTATIALPDAQKGFYRGPRFDHSGMITELKCNGHSYFCINGGPDRQNPTANDQRAAGPSEEFFEPLGFDEVKTGESFIKIGVGLLRKPYANKYFFGTAYWPIKFFPWEIKTGKNQVEFQQNISEGDWGYEYKKIVLLPNDKNFLEIKYSLKNTGKKRINTSQYAHNFIRIDSQNISADYSVKFKGKVTPLRPFPKQVEFNGKDTFVLSGKKTMFCPLEGFKNTAENHVEVTLKDKAGIVVSGDFTPYKFWLFSHRRAVCPESFIFIDLAPGESLTWSRKYELIKQD